MSGYCIYQNSFCRQHVNEDFVIKSIPPKVQKTHKKWVFWIIVSKGLCMFMLPLNCRIISWILGALNLFNWLFALKAAEESLDHYFVLPWGSLNTFMRGKERKGLELWQCMIFPHLLFSSGSFHTNELAVAHFLVNVHSWILHLNCKYQELSTDSKRKLVAFRGHAVS